MRRLRSRLKFANVISVIALMLSLGGVSYAAVSLPANSVDTKQIRRGAVTSGKLAPRSVGNGNLGRGIVKRLNSKTGSQGPTGPQGPSGAAGPQGTTGSQGVPGIPGAPGPGAVFIRLDEDGTAAPVAAPIGTVAGVTFNAACETTGGNTGINFVIDTVEAAVIQVNLQTDTGTDPTAGGVATSGNTQVNLAAGSSTPLGGPPGTPAGNYERNLTTLNISTPTRNATVSIVSLVEGGAPGHCTLNGTGVAATG